MSFLKKNMWLLVAVIGWITATIFIWKTMVTDPGNILVDVGGDAGKNYYTYLYHCMYDKGVWFHGMNYPYGENIVYTDAQPLLSVPLSYIHGITYHTALSILHLLMVLGFVLGLVFVYRILLYFKVHPAAAFIFSLLILVISPQVTRVFGHFGLSYMCVIPMLFFWSLKYHDLRKLKYIAYIFVLGCITSFLHPYFAAVLLVWACFYALSYMIVEREPFLQKLKHSGFMILSAAGVAAIVKIIMTFTDPATDRPRYPDGILRGVTSITNIFSAPDSPVSQYLDKTRWLPMGPPSEGVTYPGIVAVVTVIVSLLAFIVNRLRRRSTLNNILSNQLFSPVWLLMALMALLVAMGVPMIWNMEWLIDHVSLLRQFRTLGRFSWIFYYIITIYTTVVLYHWVQRQWANKRIATSFLFLMAVVIWSFEASGYIKRIHERLSLGLFNNYFFLSRIERNWNIYLEAEGYKASDFQAIISVPYVHVGSEKIWLLDKEEKGSWLLVLTWRVGVQTGLPIADVMMSRSAWGQMLKQVRVVGGPYANKPIFAVKDERPFLLLTSEADSVINPYDKYLVDNATYIGSHGDLKAYKLYPAKMRALDSKYRARAFQIAGDMKQKDSSSVPAGQWYVNHFDNDNGANTLFGAGALVPPEADTQILVQAPLSIIDSEARYECSGWILANSKDYRTPFFLLEYYDSGNKMLGQDIITASRATDNYKMWFRASGFYIFPPNCATVQWKIVDGAVCEGVDELQIRPEHTSIISKAPDGTIMANNHVLIKN